LQAGSATAAASAAKSTAFEARREKCVEDMR
jgi:hypothetical protein